MSGFITKYALLTACLPLAAIATPSHAETNGIEVVMNQAKIVKLSRDADTIVVGNPLIADAAVKDSRTVVITGKGFGVTNFVVLDSAGNPVVDEQVIVSRSVAETVRVYRRSKVQTLSCTPYCESAYKSDAEIKAEEETAAANN
ncbi:MAG: pilus assembly protein N-terminal domain-containing protein [Rhizobiaceae bacterium]